jgi:hypothetical protein
MNSNTTLWKSVFTTDPAAVKPITGKQYRGNSPRPYWIVQRATETFGPCGIGWGVEVKSERFERLTETDVLHVALVRVWYVFDGQTGEVEQMGQTKACYRTAKGDTLVDEDAPKKSVTDGMVKCLSMLGFAGDIFSGRWDDSRYVAFAQAETQRREEHDKAPAKPETATADATQTITIDTVTVRAAAKAAIGRVGRSLVMECLSSMGWERADEIPPDRRADVLAMLDGLRAEEAA